MAPPTLPGLLIHLFRLLERTNAGGDGLLDGRDATSHWGYQDLFRNRYPQIRFRPEPTHCFTDAAGRLVTAGGTTSWHDLALYVIARHASPGEAMRIAKVYLLKWHDEGQLPYAPLIRRQPHSDAAVRACEKWLAEHYRESSAVTRVVQHAKVPERSLKRRFKLATGLALIDAKRCPSGVSGGPRRSS